MATREPCAAALIIGNEVLTAKVRDENGPHLIARLRERGVPLLSVHTVGDDVDAIVEALLIAQRRARWVFTSGGIGPTHDDVTVRAVALALGRPVVVLPDMVAVIREHAHGKELPAAAMRLAQAPEGARLLRGEHKYPLLACDDVFMLPGVPELFRVQLETALVGLSGTPLTLRCLFVNASEPEIAPALDAAAFERPAVAIGSYPVFDRQAGYRVKITVEHASAAEVGAVVERLTRELPPGCVVRVE